ncbi:hypothetical protein [Streptomyces tanashiensis]|uniref:hypothetical protein n=1 Tax=Streptomyces tanashiensis TaxID=67367 RepID=UPI00340B73B3
MTLKAHYSATRGGKKDLLRDIRPGDLIYVVHEHSAPAGSAAKSYSEYVVTNEKDFWPNIGFKVENTITGGKDSLTGLLCRERDIYTVKPRGMSNRAAREPMDAYSDVAHRAAQRVAEIHAEEAAEDLAACYRRLARR